MQANKILDHEEKIILLTDVILSLCEEHGLNKEIVADDFAYRILGDEEFRKFVIKRSKEFTDASE